MPIYEYICSGCGKEFEERVTEFKPLGRCPFCKRSKLRQKWSVPTAIYRGSGFATTEARGITGRKRRPNIRVGNVSDLPSEEREKCVG